jgi:hypothetical protein
VGRWRALKLMVERHLELRGTDQRVDTWPLER